MLGPPCFENFSNKKIKPVASFRGTLISSLPMLRTNGIRATKIITKDLVYGSCNDLQITISLLVNIWDRVVTVTQHCINT